MELSNYKYIPVWNPDDETKPYDFCANKCPFMDDCQCDGPNFLAMGIVRLSEWCRLRKQVLHKRDPKWTNAYIAENTKSGVSLATVERFLSGRINDLKYSTAADIVQVLVNGSWGKNPCAMEAMRRILESSAPANIIAELDAAKAECQSLKNKLENTSADYQTQIDFLKHQIQMKDEQIVEKNKHLAERAAFMVRKDRAIRMLSASVAVCVVIVFVVLFVSL